MTAGGELSAAASTPLGARVHATPRAQGCQRRGARRLPSVASEAPGAPAPLRLPVRSVGRATAVCRGPRSSTARARVCAKTVQACPGPCCGSRRPRSVGPGGVARRRRRRPSGETRCHAASPRSRPVGRPLHWRPGPDGRRRPTPVPGGSAGDRAAPRGVPGAGSRRCWGRDAAGSAGARGAAGPLGGATARRRGAVRQRGPAGCRRPTARVRAWRATPRRLAAVGCRLACGRLRCLRV